MDNPAPIITERDLFDQAMALPEGVDLATFLDRSCLGDPDRAERIAALVESSKISAGVLPDKPSSWLSGAEKPGDLIGNYRLEEVVGHGAFGVVWLAEQVEPVQRRVAIKILKLGLDTQAVIARFEAERQALAVMDHPNIANVYDAGATSAGRPYFVMDYLDGESLFAFADSRRLTVEARLELIKPVVAAVQHAHQKGIIHRDLKSSNILVMEIDGKPVPKVIDFGIAKLISSPAGAEMTLAPGSWGTPAFMSPEQLAGEPVDIRTDIFSLGMILYQLLSGSVAPRSPSENCPDIAPSRCLMRLDKKGQLDSATARSTSPRDLVKTLKGELDWIVLRAAAAEPDQRYSSAGALSEDLALYCAGRPVAAGPPTKRYIVGKLIRRYRGRLALAALALCAMFAATVVSVIYARKAQKASLAMEAALYRAHLAGATAVRQSGRMGQRLQALAAVAAAAKIDPTPELRNEAIAAMALPDLELLGTLDAIPEQNEVYAYDFVSDLLLTARCDRLEIHCHHVQTGEPLGLVPLHPEPDSINRLNVSPGGAIVAVYGAARLSFYEVATGRRICQIDGAVSQQHSCIFLGSARRALVAMTAGGLAEIDLETGEERRRIETAGKVFHIFTDAAETRIVACLKDAQKIQLIDPASGAVTTTISRPGETLMETSQSPNGRFLAYGGGRGMARCQNLANEATPLVELEGHTNRVNKIWFVSDGDCLVTSAWDGTVRLWSATGSQSLRLEGTAVWASRGGDRIFIVDGIRARLYRVIPSQEVTICSQRVPTKSPNIAFSPDSTRAAICSDEGTILVALPGARVLTSFGSRHRMGNFAPDGKTLTTTGEDGVRSWDLDALTGAPNAITRHVQSEHSTVLEPIPSMYIARDTENTLLAAASFPRKPGSKQHIRILNIANGATLAEIPLNQKDITSLVFDPQGRWLAASYHGGDGFTVWDTEEWKPIANPAKGVSFINLAVNNDGRLLVTGSIAEICLWDTSTWECVQRFPCEVTSYYAKPVDFSPDGSLLACGYDTAQIQLRRVSDGAQIAKLTLPIVENYKRLKFSPDGRFLGISDETRAVFFDLEAIGKHLDLIGLGMEMP